jgi:orotate phosphoribosyltransferase
MKNSKSFEDDGRVIADMNIEGTPWYVDKKKMTQRDNVQALSKQELRYIMRNAMVAGLAVATIFIAAFAAFILFSTEIWLK